jgi:hypothetical protein
LQDKQREERHLWHAYILNILVQSKEDMVPNKTIYVKDERVWEEAKELAGKEGLSGVIADALAAWVERKKREKSGIERYRFAIGFSHGLNGGQAVRAIAFEGRFLGAAHLTIEDDAVDFPDVVIEGGLVNLEGEPVYAEVYRTKGGKVVLTAKTDALPGLPGVPYCAVYNNIKELVRDPILGAAEDGDATALLDQVSHEAGEDWALWID